MNGPPVYPSTRIKQREERQSDEKELTFARRVPAPPPPPPPLAPPVAFCSDLLDAVDERGATPPPVPTPTAGDIDRAGIDGGGPGSGPGERRCIGRDGPPRLFIVSAALLVVGFKLSFAGESVTGHRPVSGALVRRRCSVTCRPTFTGIGGFEARLQKGSGRALVFQL